MWREPLSVIYFSIVSHTVCVRPLQSSHVGSDTWDNKAATSFELFSSIKDLDWRTALIPLPLAFPNVM